MFASLAPGDGVGRVDVLDVWVVEVVEDVEDVELNDVKLVVYDVVLEDELVVLSVDEVLVLWEVELVVVGVLVVVETLEALVVELTVEETESSDESEVELGSR